MARMALLLGIESYDDSDLNNLEGVPQADVDRLQESLMLAGFERNNVKADVGRHGRSALSSRIRKFLLPPDDGADVTGHDLYVFFSGHGVEYQGRRLWVPYDYDPENDPETRNLFDEFEAHDIARQSAARSVVFFVDACRETVALRLTGTKGPQNRDDGLGEKDNIDGAGESSIREDSPTIVFVYSCESGNFSYFKPINKNKISLFTYSISEILKRGGDRPPSSLPDVVIEAQKVLNKAAEEVKVAQKIVLSNTCTVGRGGVPEELFLRDDAAAIFRARVNGSKWCQRVMALRLWDYVKAASDALEQQVCSIILAAEVATQTAHKTFPDQRWRNESLPLRFVDRLNLVLNTTDPRHDRLNPAEMAMAIAAPFVYEATLANLENILSPCDDLFDPELEPALSGKAQIAWESWCSFLKEDQAWARRSALLNKKNMPEIACDVAYYQFVQFAHYSGELWDYEAGGRSENLGWVSEQLEQLFSCAPIAEVAEDRRIAAILSGDALVTLARLMFVGVEEISNQLCGRYDRSLQTIYTGEGERQWIVRPLQLLPLLGLVGRMTLDPRRMPDILAEHIGLDEGFNLQEIHTACEAAEWITDNDKEEGLRFNLSLTCPHQALDYVLHKAIGELNGIVHEVSLAGSEVEGVKKIMPIGFADDGLVPAQEAGLPLYKRPHVRFSLDERKAMQLMMGEKLYGDPQLALRELYQNSLDACRYRQAREEFLRATGVLDDRTQDYVGRIKFVAGRNDEGIPFIECCDDGIGMNEEHLSSLFARGGRRFAESHEFQVERAAWKIHDIPFYPNSRFGIGVLSYFMLADRLQITTSRLSSDGSNRGAEINAEISGSGSLFRVRRTDSSGRSFLGSSVRLWLRDINLDPNKIMRSILEWLVLPEFETTLEFSHHERVMLAAGELTDHFVGKNGPVLPISDCIRRNGQVCLYWALPSIEDNRLRQNPLRNGLLLSDGIIPDFAGEVRKESQSAQLLRLSDAADFQEAGGFYEAADFHEAADLDDVRRIPDVRDVCGLVFNLTEDIRPALSVDRTKILNWDRGKAQLREAVRTDAGKSLLPWTDTSLEGLASLIYAQPTVMAAFDRSLRSGNHDLTIKKGVGKGINLSNIGISEFDHKLAEQTKRKTIGRGKEKYDSIYRGRLVALSNAGFELPFGLLQLSLFDRQAPKHQNPFVSTELLLLQSQNEDSPWSHAVKKVTVGEIFGVSVRYGMPIADVLELARPLIKLSLTDFDDDQLSELGSISFSSRQIELFSRHLNGEKPWLDKITTGQILKASEKWELAITDVLELARPLIKHSLTDFDDDQLSE